MGRRMSLRMSVILAFGLFLFIDTVSASPARQSRRISRAGRGRVNGGPIIISDESRRFNRLDEIEESTLPPPPPPSAPLFKQWLELESVPLAKTSAKLHGEVILECVAVGSPPPTIFWLKNDRPIAEANPTFDSEEMLNGVSPMRNPMFLQSAATSSKSMGFSMSKVKSKLPIRCIRPEDEGKYSCVADNDGRELASSTEVVIEEDDRSLDWKPECEFRLPAQEFIGKKARRGTPAYIHMSEAIHMEVIGNDIVLPCRSGGKPKPRVHWTNTEGQRVALGKKFQMNTMGDLVIKNLSWNEMGEYTCSVENPYGAESSATFLYPLLAERK